MPLPLKGSGRYMAGLDGLRAIAVLGVIAYHLNVPWMPGGLLGVAVFFVLSGYLITDLLLAEWDRHGRLDFRAFWMRRARRLLPALAVMLLAVLTWVTLVQPSLLTTLRGDVLAAVLYVSNWWFIFHHVSYFARWGPPTPLGHLWSLAVEEQFYLVWPPLLWVGLKYVRDRRWLALLVLALAGLSAFDMASLFHAGADPSRVYYGTDTRAFSILIGAALAFWWPSRSLAARRGPALIRRLNLLGALGLLVVIVMFVTTTQTSPFLYRGGMVILSVAAALVVAAVAHPATWVGRILSARPLTWVGVRSYGLYLWHYPVIVLTTPLNSTGFDWWRAGAQVAVSVTLAALSWTYLEEPIRQGHLSRFIQTLRAEHWQWRDVPDRGRMASAGAAVTLAAGLSCAGLAGLVPGSTGHVPSVTAIVPTVTVPVVEPLPMVPIGRRPLSHLAGPGPGVRLQSAGGLGSAALPAALGPKLPAGDGVTAIGDSVLIDAIPYLRQLLPGIVVDGVVGRQMYEAPTVIQWLKAHHDIGHRVFILELGTNGSFTHAQILTVLRDLGPVDHIILVNTRVPRPWQGAVNAGLLWAAAHYPHTVVVNWYRDSAGHANWFWPDDVHLNPTGSAAYARLVAHAVLAAEGRGPAS